MQPEAIYSAVSSGKATHLICNHLLRQIWVFSFLNKARKSSRLFRRDNGWCRMWDWDWCCVVGFKDSRLLIAPVNKGDFLELNFLGLPRMPIDRKWLWSVGEAIF